MAKSKFTFKTHKPTGKYRSFFKASYDIKLKNNTVGSIEPVQPHRISLKVLKDDILEDGNANCPWKWIRLKKESSSVQEAKDFINNNIDTILSKYKLYLEAL